MATKQPKKPKRGERQKIKGNGVIYARYSSHNQKDMSIEQQVEKCQELASDCGIEIIEIYEDRAISGKSDKRPGFQRMMRDAAKGKFQYVIAWKSNRIGRNMLEAMMNEVKLQELGIRLLYVEEDFDDTAAGRFAARSMMNVNQFYSENMAEDIRRGLYSNAANCMVANGHLPFGYKASDDLHYMIDEPKDDIVREIFTRVACGEPLIDIANDLNRRGIKTSRGSEWNKNSFHSVLKNERYRGIYIYGDIRKENGIPRIVSDELFYKVQEVLKTKKNPQGRHRINGDYLLTGKLYCGMCGSHMKGVSGTAKSGRLHYYYACTKKKAEKGKCTKKPIKRDYLERKVAQALKDNILRDDVIEWIADNVERYQRQHKDNPELVILQDRLGEIRVSIKNILAAIEQGIITSSTKERLQELESEQSQISGKIAVLNADHIEVKREDVIAWVESFRDGDIESKEYQALLFDTFLVAVYLYDDGHIKIVFDVSGGERTVDIDLLKDDAEAKDGAEEGSFKLSFAPPKKFQGSSEAWNFLTSSLFTIHFQLKTPWIFLAESKR